MVVVYGEAAQTMDIYIYCLLLIMIDYYIYDAFFFFYYYYLFFLMPQHGLPEGGGDSVMMIGYGGRKWPWNI